MIVGSIHGLLYLSLVLFILQQHQEKLLSEKKKKKKKKKNKRKQKKKKSKSSSSESESEDEEKVRERKLREVGGSCHNE